MSGQISIGRPKAGDETEAMRRPDSFHVEGGLWKLGKRWNVNAKAGLWHKKFAILHDKTFHVYESQRSFHDGEPSRRVPLQGATIQRLDEADGVRATPSCFIIGVSDPFEARCHIFAVSTEESRTHWIECMEDAAKAQKGRHASMPDISAEDRAGAMSKLEATGEDGAVVDALEIEMRRKSRIQSYITEMQEEEKNQKKFERRKSLLWGGGQ
uniref:PH domain-containing protein n=1 Tax=Hemiselmis andersenii TaxID=464988 RepID=A0A6U2HMW5_HEMAN|mmetsp:Transcript_41486/g.96872  ORF Transcript_41486/g.96872 Transcript_41486/m.96872 type:complete len:212 (+) Transcript_41486:97-732(+)